MTEPYPAYTYSTTWEQEWQEELEEIVEARANLATAIEEGTEPKDWPISGEDGTEWPREAIFPLSKKHPGKAEVRFDT